MTQHVIKPSIYLVKGSNTTQKYLAILRLGVVLKHARNCQVSHRGDTVLPARFFSVIRFWSRRSEFQFILGNISFFYLFIAEGAPMKQWFNGWQNQAKLDDKQSTLSR